MDFKRRYCGNVTFIFMLEVMASQVDGSLAGHTLQGSKGKYRPEIDGLRAFAVIAVIINHFNKDLLPSGYLGVDIFFVISGYVITASLASRESKNFLEFLTGFYERRIKRLVPALLVFVLITSILISLVNPVPGDALSLGWKALFGMSNISLYQSSTDYFSQSTKLNPFTHTWSLGVEEQFYLLFPFLIWFSGFGQQTAKGARNLFCWVGALTIASLIGYLYLYKVNQMAAYFLMPPRFWEMAAGCLIFIGFHKRAKIEEVLEKIPPLLVVAAMTAVMFRPIGGKAGTIAIVVLSAVLIACLKKGTAAYQLFTLDKIVFVGLISYSLYLWHWTVLTISIWTIGIHWWTAPFQVGLMVLLAMGSYRFVESPSRNLKPKIKWRGVTSIVIGMSGIAVAAAFVNYLKDQGARIIALKPVHQNTYKNWWKNDNGEPIDHCHVRRHDASRMRECLSFGQNTSDKRAFLIGDSHSRNYLMATKELFGKDNVRYYTRGGCAYQPYPIADKDCQNYSVDVKKFLEANTKSRDTVFMGQILIGGNKMPPQYSSGISSLAQKLAGKRARVVLFDGTAPPTPYFQQFCYKEWWRPFPDKADCEVSLSNVIKRYAEFDQQAMSMSRKIDNFYYAPLRTGLCVTNICGSYTSRGTPIWHDESGHITESSSRELKSLLASFLDKGGKSFVAK
ncbi:MAG: acyltransferase family protein [Cyanobacteriota bacterium]